MPNRSIHKTHFILLSILIMLLSCSFLISSAPRQELQSQPDSTPLYTNVVYQFGNILIQNQSIDDNILIENNANVTVINSTIHGNIYIFNWGRLTLLQKSNVTGDIILSDLSRVTITNSTLIGRIECRDTSSIELLNSTTPLTTIWKFDSANITIINSSIAWFYEFGIGGQNLISNSQTNVALNGFSTSRTYIQNSIIPLFYDSAIPYGIITGPLRMELAMLNITYTTSERIFNLTWIGWDSPIIDNYLNITFKIFVDNLLHDEINGSGFFNQYSGSRLLNFTTPGPHNITLISIDSAGHNFSFTIKIKIIEYPSFPWLLFFVICTVILGIITLAVVYVNIQEKRGRHISLGTIFKKELAENKVKLIIFMVIGAVPGIILYLLFSSLTRLYGSAPPFDSIRGVMNMVFTMFLYYFAMIFSIIFGSGAIANARKSGALSWFLSKPVKRWEFLWGKIFAYIVIAVLIMVSLSLSFVIGCLRFVDPLYIPDMLSMGGYVFLIGIIALIPLISIVILCSSVLKKSGLAIFIPIMLLVIIPPLVSFLPMLTRHEWPLLLSFTYYFEKLGSFWISNTGGLFGSISSSYGQLLGITITPINLTPLSIVLILAGISIVCLIIATIYLEKTDVE